MLSKGSVSPDFKDLLSEFNARGVEYLIVGAYALAAHGHVRATGDLDVWIRADKANAARVLEALQAYGAPTDAITEDDLSRPGTVFQIGVPPFRIDVLTAIDGVDFAEAWASRFSTDYAGQKTPVLSVRHLIKNKRAVGRPQDLADLDWLEKSGKK